MPTKINVVLLFGGKSTEHEVSIKSARAIYNAIDKKKFKVSKLKIDKRGNFPKDAIAFSPACLPAGRHDNKSKTVFFPILHGPNGEDGTVQGMLEIMNLPYVGSGVTGSAIGMDKTKQKEILLQHGFPIVPYQEINPGTKLSDFKDFPYFVKPVNAGSSVGINKAHNAKELKKFISVAQKYDEFVLVEKGLEDIREIEVALLGGLTVEASVCGEISPGHEFYDYEAKYSDGISKAVIPANISLATSNKIRKLACEAFKILRLSGLTRADFFLTKNNEIYFNEVNTIPGFTQTSMYPKLWKASGIPFGKLVEKLITLGLTRWQRKQNKEFTKNDIL